MKSPQFGLWLQDDEKVFDTGEPADEKAEQALLLVESFQAKAALDLYADEQPHQRIATTCRTAKSPSGLPNHAYEYERPLKRGEAEALLKSAGIAFQQVVHTYVADWTSLIDQAGTVLRPRAQCIIAEVPAEQVYSGKKVGETTVNVHFFFVYVEEKKGWRLIRAMLEQKF